MNKLDIDYLDIFDQNFRQMYLNSGSSKDEYDIKKMYHRLLVQVLENIQKYLSKLKIKNKEYTNQDFSEFLLEY